MGRHLIYQIAVGETPGFYKSTIASVSRYCETYGIRHIVQREPILKIAPKASCRSTNALRLGYLPIYEKEAAFSHLDDYSAIAVIDADVYIRPNAPNIFTQLGDATFAGVLERDMPLTPAYLDKIQKYSKGQYSTLTDVDWLWTDTAAFYNMGVMLFSDRLREYLFNQTPREFIQRPEFERFVNGEGHWKWSTDQTLLNWWVKQSGMPTKDLNWRWNALYGGVTSVDSAYFVHFFLSAKLPRRGAEIPGIIAGL